MSLVNLLAERRRKMPVVLGCPLPAQQQSLTQSGVGDCHWAKDHSVWAEWSSQWPIRIRALLYCLAEYAGRMCLANGGGFNMHCRREGLYRVQLRCGCDS